MPDYFRLPSDTHEFEALLFAAPQALADHAGQADLATALGRISRSCGGPEAIDESPETAPARRLQNAWPGFSKVVDSAAILERVGVPTIRAQCPHFDGWVLSRKERVSGGPLP